MVSGEKLIFAINFKAYLTAFNERAVEIAKSAEKISKEYSGVRIILAVPQVMLFKIANSYEDVYVEHVDPVPFGAHTGSLPAEALTYLPAKGVLLNHSEHKVTLRAIGRSVEAVKKARKEILLCADTPEEAAALAHYGPDMIAVEPPELIGSGIPVSRARPEVITSGVEAVKSVDPQISVLAGAGISTPGDAIKAVELGARGVLIASAVMKAEDPGKVIEDFVRAMNRLV